MDEDIPQVADPMIGRTLGGCVIEAHLGTGATGAVYRARQISLDRPLAIKILHPYVALHEVIVTRFAREARVAASLQHPNLVQIFDFGQQDGLYFYTMELVEGSSLGDYLRAGRVFDEPWCRHIARQAVSALDLAHSAGIIHRDVKPDNMILDAKGMLKISDLGLARIGPAAEEQSLTMTGDTLGTPYYMSPEQVQDSRLVDFRSDYYSLGATLFHLVTGRPPFEGETRFSVMTAHVSSPPPAACEVNPSVSRGFSDFISWLMRKSPEARPGSAEEMLAALDALDRGEQPPVQPLGTARAEEIIVEPEARREKPGAGRVALIAAEILLLALLGAGAFFLVNRSKEPDGSNAAETGPPAPSPLPEPEPAPSPPPFPQAPQIVIQPPAPAPITLSLPTVKSLTIPHSGPGRDPVVSPAPEPSPQASIAPLPPPLSDSAPQTPLPSVFAALLTPDFVARQTDAYAQAAEDRRVKAEAAGMRFLNLYEFSPPALRFDLPQSGEEGAVLRAGNPLIIRPAEAPAKPGGRSLLAGISRSGGFKASLVLAGLVVTGYGSVEIFAQPQPGAARPGSAARRRVAAVQVGPGRGQIFSFPVTETVRRQLDGGQAEEFQVVLAGGAEVLLSPSPDFKPPFAPRLELLIPRPGAVPVQRPPR